MTDAPTSEPAAVIDLQAVRDARARQQQVCWTCANCRSQLMLVLPAGPECAECGNFWSWDAMDGLDLPPSSPPPAPKPPPPPLKPV